jgi:predicted ferric reductase
MSLRLKKLFWYGLLIANTLFIFWYWTFWILLPSASDPNSILIAVAKLFGFLAAYAVMLQFFFMGRMPWLERVFGLDKLSRLHHLNGRLAIVFILLHPLLMTAGYGQMMGKGLWEQYLSIVYSSDDLFLASVGMWLFVVVVASSLFIVRRRLKYEYWYWIHLLVYIAIGSAFFHQVEVGSDLVTKQAFYWYWISLYVLVFGSHLVFRIIRPGYNFRKHDFTVNRTMRETYNVLSVYITGKNIERFRIKPGQFMIFRFLQKGLWWQTHPFSLSFYPNGKELRISVKELGDYTKRLQELQPGTKVIIDGPYGVFTEQSAIKDKALFIVGGIGITPVRSLLEQYAQSGKDAILLYGNRSSQDIVFKEELDELAGYGTVKIIHVLSDEPNYTGESGRIDDEKIKRLVPDFLSRDIFLCGPPPMMEGLIVLLQSLGVPKKQIHYERFSLP